MADLFVAPSYEGVSGAAVLDAVPVAGNIASAAESFGSGDIGGGILDVAGTALDVVDMMVNPIATLASSCASFLLDYMPPLHQALELLTGSPEMVRALGETWDNLGGALEEVASARGPAVQALLASWTGVAADAYAKLAEGLTQIVESVAQASHGVANGLRNAAMIVEIVYEIVKSIISDLVGQLIQAVVIAMATVGVGLPAVVAQCSSKIATRVPQVAKWVEKIQEVMKKISDIVDKLTMFQHEFEINGKAISQVLSAAEPLEITVNLPGIVDAVRTSAENNNGEK
ncbi:WXG100 family type VII secretion target [Microbacterium sp. SORGH_AS_0862]|uniref:WXG100 family type VII secretion target n=1 Tax=Microbacterium sp. SORGH_AS_0862 TaxID=3041789 RepID=UPI00278EAE55|nr:hypothetical protein [Microbacterium sp. SORGH_AS_0862]MDQ1204791.1 uncharacterized protein YukE [Microbacterium sp. SORGH_AS_0862]